MTQRSHSFRTNSGDDTCRFYLNGAPHTYQGTEFRHYRIGTRPRGGWTVVRVAVTRTGGSSGTGYNYRTTASLWQPTGGGWTDLLTVGLYRASTEDEDHGAVMDVVIDHALEKVADLLRII
jgi:hypothetical protein